MTWSVAGAYCILNQQSALTYYGCHHTHCVEVSAIIQLVILFQLCYLENILYISPVLNLPLPHLHRAPPNLFLLTCSLFIFIFFISGHILKYVYHILNYLIWLGNSFPRFPDCDEPYPRPEDLLTGSDPTNQSSMTVQRDYGFWCPRELKVDPDLGYTFMGRKDCSAPCPSMFFNQQELTFIRYFIGVVSIVCLSATLFTFLTFLIDVTRFEWLNLSTYWVWSLLKLKNSNLLFC